MEQTWQSRVNELRTWGWSLVAIGEAIGLSPQGVSDIRAGRTKAPTGMAAILLHKLHTKEKKKAA